MSIYETFFFFNLLYHILEGTNVCDHKVTACVESCTLSNHVVSSRLQILLA